MTHHTCKPRAQRKERRRRSCLHKAGGTEVRWWYSDDDAGAVIGGLITAEHDPRASKGSHAVLLTDRIQWYRSVMAAMILSCLCCLHEMSPPYGY